MYKWVKRIGLALSIYMVSVAVLHGWIEDKDYGDSTMFAIPFSILTIYIWQQLRK